jgi:hypothetical protein
MARVAATILCSPFVSERRLHKRDSREVDSRLHVGDLHRALAGRGEFRPGDHCSAVVKAWREGNFLDQNKRAKSPKRSIHARSDLVLVALPRKRFVAGVEVRPPRLPAPADRETTRSASVTKRSAYGRRGLSGSPVAKLLPTGAQGLDKCYRGILKYIK